MGLAPIAGTSRRPHDQTDSRHGHARHSSLRFRRRRATFAALDVQGAESHQPGGRDIFVRSGGSGPVVVLLHGYAETSDSWGPLAAELAKSYTVVVPDLRGMGAPLARQEVTTRKHKPRISGPSSRRSGTTGRRWFRTTSASWSPTPMRRATRTRSNGSSSWTRRSRASRPGMTSCEIRRCGISPSTVPMPNGSCKDASESILTASGTPSRAIRPAR